MAKTNFTKVEQALIEGLRKMKVERLLQLADESNAKHLMKPKEQKIVIPEARRLVIAALKQDIRLLQKKKVKF